jgi:predicted ester cyclase
MYSQSRNILIACFILFALGGVFRTATAGTEANKAISRRDFEEALNQGKLEVYDEILAPEAILHTVGGDIIGLDAIKGFASMIIAAFPDINFTIEDIVAEGDLVGIRWTNTGTQQGEYLGIPTTGISTVGAGMAIHRITDSKIQELWLSADDLGMLEQLGAMPPTRETYTWGTPSAVTGDPGDPEMNKAIFQRMIDEVFKGNLAVIDEVLAADYVKHDPASPTEVQGPEGFKQWLGTMSEPYFSQGNITVEDMIGEGDKVVVRWTWSGTHTGEFMGISPTGRQITVKGTCIHRFANGKFVESWSSYDVLGMMQQLTIPEWPLAGAWVERIPPWENVVEPGIALHKLTPLDPEGNRLLYTVKFVNEVVSLPGLPPIDYVSQFVGEAVKTGLNTYEYTVVCYAATQQEEPGQRRGQVRVIAMITSRAELIDYDHRYDTQMYMWFTADQDVNPADGFPDEGQDPIITLGPFEGDAFTRVPLVPLPEVQ